MGKEFRLKMTHWKEIEEKHNKLVDLLLEKGIINKLEAFWMYSEEYKTIKVEE